MDRSVRTRRLLLLVAAGIGVFVAPAGCFPMFECEDSAPLLDVISPSGRFVASVFTRDCGATTATSTLVNLRPVSQALAKSENAAVAAFHRQPAVKPVWVNDTSLILYVEQGELARCDASFGAIRIEVRPLAP